MKFSPLLSDLIKSLQVLPGVGPKTAKRMAMSLLGGNEADAKNLANNLSRAIDLIGTCQNCRVLSEDQICSICNDSSRDSTQVCVVENTSQVVQIEELGGFKGIYFVLGGYLSPIEGRGPNEIGLSELNSKALSGEIKELILAFNSCIFVMLMIGIQNSLNKKKVNLVLTETVSLPISFIIGTSFISGSLLGGVFSVRKKKE